MSADRGLIKFIKEKVREVVSVIGVEGSFMKSQGFTGKVLAAIFIMIAVAAFKSSVSMGSDDVPKFVEYVSSGNYFKCSIPAEWSVYQQVFGLSEEKKKVYGVTLFGPQENEVPVNPEISIRYFAPGNLLHKTMDLFIRRNSGPALGLVLEGQSYGEVREIEFAGRKARVFERTDIRFIGKEAINMPKVSIFERFIIIPASKDEGFYVLRLSVLAEIREKYTGIFEETVKSFLPER